MKPKHYAGGDLEPLKIIQDRNLPFELGNALKYIARCNHKGTKREDLEKAIDYLERYIDRMNATPMPDNYEMEEGWGISKNLAKAAEQACFLFPEDAIWFIKQELNNE